MDKLVSDIRMAMLRKSMERVGGENTTEILDIERKLRKIGWSIALYYFSIPEMTAYINFTTKEMWVNISSAYYASKLFQRLEFILDPQYITENAGLYKYQFLEGETIDYRVPPGASHTQFSYLYLSVEKVDVMEILDTKDTTYPVLQE